MNVETIASQGVIEGTSLIGGSPVLGYGGLTAFDRRTGVAVDPVFGFIGADELDMAANLAAEAFDSYRMTTAEQRARLLETIAENIEAIGDPLADRVVTETGLPRARAVQETARTTGQLRMFAAMLREGNFHDARIDPAIPDRTPAPRADIRLRKVPLGPVAVFGASNFPLAFSVAGGDTASALAAGCPVIVKAHAAHPGTAELVGRAVCAAVALHGLHEGVFALVFGRGNEIGTRLVEHPAIAAVGFTGSRSGGLALMDAAARRPIPIPVYAEMSSINPVFALPSAMRRDPEALAVEWVDSLTMGAGQFCTNPGLIFVPAGNAAADFCAAAHAALVRTISAPMLTDAIASSYAAGVRRIAANDAISELAVGHMDPSIPVSGVPFIFMTDASAFLAEPDLHEEVFGPAGIVVTVRDSAEMVDILRTMEGQLTVTIHGDETDADVRDLIAVAELRAGRILFNGWPTGVEVGHAMVHGGPFPATSNSRSTSVGTMAIDRFLRPVSYQNFPEGLLPDPIASANPLGIWRELDGALIRD